MTRVLIALTLLLMPLLTRSAAAQCSSTLAASGGYGTAQGASGNAQYVVYMPQPSTCFNGIVLLYAHGYVPVGAPAGSWLSQLQLPDGTSIPALVNSLGFGFAASSFSKDGLAVLQGIQDTKALVNVLQSLHIPVRKVFITGASERNWASYAEAISLPPDFPKWQRHILTDPQTSGGLLIACNPDLAAGALRAIIDAGYPHARLIGHAKVGPPSITVRA